MPVGAQVAVAVGVAVGPVAVGVAVGVGTVGVAVPDGVGMTQAQHPSGLHTTTRSGGGQSRGFWMHAPHAAAKQPARIVGHAWQWSLQYGVPVGAHVAVAVGVAVGPVAVGVTVGVGAVGVAVGVGRQVGGKLGMATEKSTALFDSSPSVTSLRESTVSRPFRR